MTKLDRETLFPSARALLESGISCRSPKPGGWAVYWMEGGSELTLFPGGEGPQEASSVDEIIEWIGGDQECVLTPASLRRFGVETKKGAKPKPTADVVAEWRQLTAHDPFVKCSICDKIATNVLRVKTPQMAGSGYYYYCPEHSADVASNLNREV